MMMTTRKKAATVAAAAAEPGEWTDRLDEMSRDAARKVGQLFEASRTATGAAGRP